MKLVFYNELIRGNEIIFWTYVISMILIIIITCIFVKKEVKKWS